MMEYIDTQESAKFLFKHRQNKLSINDLPHKLTPKNDKDAYIIQEELKLLYLSLKDNISIKQKVFKIYFIFQLLQMLLARLVKC